MGSLHHDRARWPFAAGLLLAGTLGSAEARADGGERFGEQGQLVIGGSSTLAFRHVTTRSPGGREGSIDVFGLVASLDYFVAPSFSLGVEAGYAHASVDEGSVSGGTLAPRLGFNVGISDSLSFWPKAGVQYLRGSLTNSDASLSGLGDVTIAKFTLQIYAPLVIHAAPHFFVGVGPSFSTDLSSQGKIHGDWVDGSKDTKFGLATMIGGYL